MIVLCGFAVSNYYNKVKLALLEKGLAFTEEAAPAGGTSEAQLAASPLGKIPFLRTEHGTLCESQVILDYLEAAHPTPALLPADPWQAAKVRELITFLDLHLELATRPLYAEAFFGGTVSDGTKAMVRKQLDRNLPAFKRLAKFSPYVAGEQFTAADCAAWVHLPLVGLATKIIYGEDLVLAGGIDWKSYAKLIGERPAAQQVTADRKVAQERMAKK
ncbi:MAG: glutathione S-transferase [Ideonella sp.]|nr:glutathione S-transferase [Ideonella sp.]